MDAKNKKGPPHFSYVGKGNIFWEGPKFFEISTVDLSYVYTVKSIVEISQNFVAFSEYMNFTNIGKMRRAFFIFCIQKCPNPLINLIEHVSKDKRGNYSLTWQMILSWDRKCAGRNGILLTKLFWPTVRKNCFSDREIFWN